MRNDPTGTIRIQAQSAACENSSLVQRVQKLVIHLGSLHGWHARIRSFLLDKYVCHSFIPHAGKDFLIVDHARSDLSTLWPSRTSRRSSFLEREEVLDVKHPDAARISLREVARVEACHL